MTVIEQAGALNRRAGIILHLKDRLAEALSTIEALRPLLREMQRQAGLGQDAAEEVEGAQEQEQEHVGGHEDGQVVEGALAHGGAEKGVHEDP